jgi:hypothetical protein
MNHLGAKALESLRPEGGWIIYGEDFDSIVWVSCEPVTKADFNKALAQLADEPAAKS